MSGYTPDGDLVEIANQDVQRCCRLAHWVDKMNVRISKKKKQREKLKLEPNSRSIDKLYRARLRIYSRIRNLVSEIHWKAADYLCKNFDIILLPSFETSKMVARYGKNNRRRRISKSTVRRLQILSHYTFKMRLLQKAQQRGKMVLIVNEAYTTKTCGRCGYQHQTLGGSKVYKCRQCNLTVGRDINGARNILLRNLVPRF